MINSLGNCVVSVTNWTSSQNNTKKHLLLHFAESLADDDDIILVSFHFLNVFVSAWYTVGTEELIA